MRTGGASRAVLRLGDGSLVEMSERAELSVTARGRDTTIHLMRGRIIVQAAKRRSGHLRVASGDCTVSVTPALSTVVTFTSSSDSERTACTATSSRSGWRMNAVSTS